MFDFNPRDLDILARTLHGEARGEPTDGQIAVAWVIRNRASRARFAGDLACRAGATEKVCLAPWQFSCWNKGDPNRALLLTADIPAHAAQLAVAGGVLEGTIPDPTGGADHYYTEAAPVWAGVWPPSWAAGMPKRTIGAHVFLDSGAR
jgi:N-acetylmuramoyl-L-alanine amidase